MQVFPRLQELTIAGTKLVRSAATAGTEVDIADIGKRITSDVMGSMLLDQDFGGIEMRYVHTWCAALKELGFRVLH